jgi:hypothetical protein
MRVFSTRIGTDMREAPDSAPIIEMAIFLTSAIVFASCFLLLSMG